MSRQSEYKKKFDPELGKFRLQHIYGEGPIVGGGVKDVFKNIGAKLFGQSLKTAAKKKAKAAATEAITRTGEYAGKKAGDKIVELLSKGNRGTYGSPYDPLPLPKNPLLKKLLNKI